MHARESCRFVEDTRGTAVARRLEVMAQSAEIISYKLDLEENSRSAKIPACGVWELGLEPTSTGGVEALTGRRTERRRRGNETRLQTMRTEHREAGKGGRAGR